MVTLTLNNFNHFVSLYKTSVVICQNSKECDQLQFVPHLYYVSGPEYTVSPKACVNLYCLSGQNSFMHHFFLFVLPSVKYKILTASVPL